MLTNKWWLSVWVGIPLAVLVGMALCWPLRSDLFYLNYYHLYYTAGVIVTGKFDRAAACIVPGLLLLLLLGTLLRQLRRPARIVVLLAAVACCTAIIHLLRYDVPAWQAIYGAASALSRHSNLPFILPGAIGGLFILVLLLRALTRIRRFHAASHPLRRALMPASLLLILVFLFVNLGTGALYLRNVMALRHRPNIIYIMVDTLRADHLGCYGYRRNTSPNIDRFASESTLFSQTLAQAPFTPWSVFSFMSSHYPDIPSVEINNKAYYYRYPLLADYLREQGYDTSAITSNDMVKMISQFRAGFTTYDDSTAVAMEGSTSPQVTDAALNQLDRLRARKTFLFLLYFDPHEPYIAHPGFSFAHDRGGLPPRALSLAANHTASSPPGTREAVDVVNAYDGEIAFTDAEIGRLLDALKARGLYDDALIVFLSDHGEELMEHGHTGHMYTLYNEVLNVPLIVKMPGQRQGTVTGGAFQLLDLAPSVLGMLGSGNPAYLMSGKDMHLQSLRNCPDRPIYGSTINQASCVRDSRNSFIHNSFQRPEEFFRLTGDPWEQHDLAKRQPRDAAAWRSVLQARDAQAPLRGCLQAVPAVDEKPTDKIPVDKLRSLGYLQ